MGGDSVPTPHFETKKAMYVWLNNQVELLIDGLSTKFTPDANMIIALSNVSALCYHTLNHFHSPEAPLHSVPVNWFGFYILQAPGILGLGPFQGRPACTSIRVGRGVCGTAVAQKKSLVIQDVHQFPGHIACDSASNSEIVVPIILPDVGGVVGLIDVDSINMSQFDEVDREGLEGVAATLLKHVAFPMTKVLSLQPSFDTPAAAEVPPYSLPSYAFGPNQPHPVVGFGSSGAVGSLSEHLTATPLPTKIPAVRIERRDPNGKGADAETPDARTTLPNASDVEVEEKDIGGWHFTSRRCTRITNENETDELEMTTGIKLLPEIMYLNHLNVVDSITNQKILQFDLASILSNAKEFYQSPVYVEKVKETFRLPASEKWVDSPFQRMDSGVDWAWRNNFFGVLPSRVTLCPLGPNEENDPSYNINWDLLRNQQMPIRFYTALTFFEDDLHDSGEVECSLKARVMEKAFFILFRHALVVHGPGLSAGGIVREVRLFQEFGKRDVRGFPIIAVEEKLTCLPCPPTLPQDEDENGAISTPPGNGKEGVQNGKEKQPVAPRQLSLDQRIAEGKVKKINKYYLRF